MLNTFNYHGLSFSFDVTYRFGYYFLRPSLSYSNLFNQGNGHPEYAQRWQQRGDEAHTNVPSMVYPIYDNVRDAFYNGSSINVLRGDQLRLQDARVQYDLNKSMKK